MLPVPMCTVAGALTGHLLSCVINHCQLVTVYQLVIRRASKKPGYYLCLGQVLAASSVLALAVLATLAAQ